MMPGINLTFFIQIFNFLLTYYLLDKLVFSSVIKSLNKKQQEWKTFMNNLQKEENVLLEREKEKKAQLINFQIRMAQESKKITIKPKEIDINLTYKRDEKEVVSLVEQVKDLIVKEVPRVR